MVNVSCNKFEFLLPQNILRGSLKIGGSLEDAALNVTTSNIVIFVNVFAKLDEHVLLKTHFSR